MKKIHISVLSIIGLVIVVVIASTMIFKTTNIDAILPQDPIAYVQVSQIDKTVKEIKESTLWANLTAIDVENLLKETGASAEDIERYNSFKQEVASPVLQLLVDQLFSKEIAIAFYAPDLTGLKSKEEILSKAASSFVLVSRLKSKSQFIDLSTKIYSKISKDYTSISQKYNKTSITAISSSDKTIMHYTMIDDLLILSISEEMIKKCIDVSGNSALSLAKDANYLLTLSKLTNNKRAFSHMNPHKIFDLIVELSSLTAGETAGKLSDEQEQLIKEKLLGQRTWGTSSTYDKLIHKKFIITLDKEKLSEEIQQMVSFSPEKNSSFQFIPDNTIFYQWNNYFDIKTVWNRLLLQLSKKHNQSPQIPSPTVIVSSLESNLGISIDDEILPAFGNEIGGFLTNIDLNGPFPIPKAVLFVKIDDIDNVSKLLNNFMAGKNIPNSDEEYESIGITHVPLPFGTGLQPAYCYLSDFLLISTNKETLIQCIDTFKGKQKNISQTQEFKKVNSGLTDKNNFISFTKLNDILTEAEKLCQWGVKWLSFVSINQKNSYKKVEESIVVLTKDIAKKEEELKVFKDSKEKLLTEVKKEEVEESITSKEKEIAQARKALLVNKQKLKQIKAILTQDKKPSEVLKVAIEEILIPIIDGLKDFKAASTKTNISNDTIETDIYIYKP